VVDRGSQAPWLRPGWDARLGGPFGDVRGGASGALEGGEGGPHAPPHVPITVTSYHMLSRLSCWRCRALRKKPTLGWRGLGEARNAAAADRKGGNPEGMWLPPAAAAAAVRAGGRKPAEGPLQNWAPRGWGAPDHAHPMQCHERHCMAGAVGRGAWGCVVVDESHCLKVPEARNPPPYVAATLATVRGARRATLLTGTPSMSKPFDLGAQIDALRPGLLGARTDFGRRYCHRVHWRRRLGPDGRGWFERTEDFGGARHIAEIHGLLKSEIMVRRLKEEVVDQMPPLRRRVVRLPPPARSAWPGVAVAAAGDSDAGKADARADAAAAAADPLGDSDPFVALGDGDGLMAGAGSSEQRVGLAKVPGAMAWLRNQLLRLGGDDEGKGEEEDKGEEDVRGVDDSNGGGGGATSAAVVDEDGLDEDADADTDVDDSSVTAHLPRIVVFAHHRKVMNAWAAELALLASSRPGIPRTDAVVRIEGSTPERERFEACKLFNMRGSPARFALVSITAGGTGLDLSSASHVVFAELPGQAGLAVQAEARAHRRGGSPGGVQVHYLVAQRTVDERTWSGLMGRLCSLRAVHDGVGLRGVRSPLAGQGPDRGEAAAVAAAAQEWVEDVGTQHGSQRSSRRRWHGSQWSGQLIPGTDDNGAADGTEAVQMSMSDKRLFARCGDRRDDIVVMSATHSEGLSGLAGSPTPLVLSDGSLVSASPTPQAGSDEERGAAQRNDAGEDDVASPSPPPAVAPTNASQKPAATAMTPLPPASLTPPCVDTAPPLSLWFEVSRNTDRIHLHRSPCGGHPMGVSVPLVSSMMLHAEGPAHIFEAIAKAAMEAAEAEARGESARGASGLSLAYGATAHAAVACLTARERADAAEITGRFAREWCELSAMIRNRLQGEVLPADLAGSVAALDAGGSGRGAADAAAEPGLENGATVGANRVALPPGLDPARLPVGAEVVDVLVASRSASGVYSTARQAVTWPCSTAGVRRTPQTRLCVQCATPLPGSPAPALDVVTPYASLFCSSSCAVHHEAACTGAGLRRQLGAIERGVCQMCRLDTRSVVLALQAVRRAPAETTMDACMARREAVLRRLAPVFFQRGVSGHRARLLRTCQEGCAWNADHIRAVHLGGGGCGVLNARTLCVPCHAGVTKAQAEARAAGRKAAKRRAAAGLGQATLDTALARAKKRPLVTVATKERIEPNGNDGGAPSPDSSPNEIFILGSGDMCQASSLPHTRVASRRPRRSSGVSLGTAASGGGGVEG